MKLQLVGWPGASPLDPTGGLTAPPRPPAGLISPPPEIPGSATAEYVQKEGCQRCERNGEYVEETPRRNDSGNMIDTIIRLNFLFRPWSRKARSW